MILASPVNKQGDMFMTMTMTNIWRQKWLWDTDQDKMPNVHLVIHFLLFILRKDILCRL